jgi:2-succinyl-5-enolpyruvyl-6-hydroxy-3-cyclohexene-1-carboxylate synthase
VARGEPRPGPVHLNLAWREPLAPVEESGAVSATDSLALEGREGRPLRALAPPVPAPGDFVLSELARHAGNAERGLIVAGRQTDPGLRDPLAALAGATGFPILAEPTSQLRFGPHDRSLIVSAYDSILRAGVHPGEADLVLRFGEMPTSKPLRQWLATSSADQLVIDPAGGWNEPTRRAAAIIRADPVALAKGVSDRVTPVSEAGWANAWVEADTTARKAIEQALAGFDELTEPGLAAALGGAYADGDLVYTGSSMPIRDQEAFLTPGDADALFLCNRGANGIDGLISSGIGAAHASGRPTVIVTGDLGLLHDIGSLATLRDVTTPVRIVVVDNDGGGIFSFLPQAEALDSVEFENLLGTPRGVDVGGAAELFGLEHHLVGTLEELGPALGAGTGLIEVPVDRSSNVAVHAELTATVKSRLG